MRLFLSLLALSLLSCKTSAGRQGTSLIKADSQDDIVTAFDNEYLHHERQTAIRDIPFPSLDVSYEKITLEFTLSCPNGRCDYKDRPGDLHLLRTVDGQEQAVEILRFMTPYGVGGTWTLDVTHLRLLLSDNVKLRLFIKTFVKKGDPGGDGWSATVRFRFTPGEPENLPVALIPLWGSEPVWYGDPAKPSKREIRIQLPDVEFSKMFVVSFITGHGQGNMDNCAEFCDKSHTLTINGTPHETRIWRSDCKDNPIKNQKGNWTLSREGWCPGDIVKPWWLEIPSGPVKEVSITYEPEPYVNTCRPDSSDCSGCWLILDCTYKEHVMQNGLLVEQTRPVGCDLANPSCPCKLQQECRWDANGQALCPNNAANCETCKISKTCEYTGGRHVEPRFLVSSYLVLTK
ncbi:MAG: peptide-N-glycosidase F-related protein [Oligoflexales bacterium]